MKSEKQTKYNINYCQTPNNLDSNSTILLEDDMSYLLAKTATILYLLFSNTQELFMKEEQNVAKSHKNASFLLNVLSSQTLGIAQTNITIALNKTWQFESLCSSERVCDKRVPSKFVLHLKNFCRCLFHFQ